MVNFAQFFRRPAPIVNDTSLIIFGENAAFVEMVKFYVGDYLEMLQLRVFVRTVCFAVFFVVSFIVFCCVLRKFSNNYMTCMND